MSPLSASIKRHPLPGYFVMAFAISWGGALLAIGGPSGIPGSTRELQALFPVVLLAMLAGPTVAGLFFTGLIHGRAGFRELWSRLLRWRVAARWYVLAILAAPAMLLATLLALSRLHPELLPGIFASDDKASLLLTGFLSALGAGALEELGWTGFAIPALRRRHGVFTTGVIIGLLWGAWHFLVNFWGSGDSTGKFAPGVLLNTLLSSVVGLPAFRVLMVWVYDRTGSLFVAVLMHASLTASSIILRPLTAATVPLLAYCLGSAAVNWAVVAGVVMASGMRREAAPGASV